MSTLTSTSHNEKTFKCWSFIYVIVLINIFREKLTFMLKTDETYENPLSKRHFRDALTQFETLQSKHTQIHYHKSVLLSLY